MAKLQELLQIESYIQKLWDDNSVLQPHLTKVMAFVAFIKTINELDEENTLYSNISYLEKKLNVKISFDESKATDKCYYGKPYINYHPPNI